MLPLTPTVQIPSHDGSIKKLTWHQDHTMCATGTANKELPILLQFAIKKYNSFRSPLAFIANSTIISKSWLHIPASISNLTIYCCPKVQKTTPNGGAILAPTKALSPSLVQSLIYTSKSSSHTKYVSKSASIATRQYKNLVSKSATIAARHHQNIVAKSSTIDAGHLNKHWLDICQNLCWTQQQPGFWCVNRCWKHQIYISQVCGNRYLQQYKPCI